PVVIEVEVESRIVRCLDVMLPHAFVNFLGRIAARFGIDRVAIGGGDVLVGSGAVESSSNDPRADEHDSYVVATLHWNLLEIGLVGQTRSQCTGARSDSSTQCSASPANVYSK